MAHIPEFDLDLDETLGVLNSISEKFAEGSRERDVSELAQIALFYIFHARKVDDFKTFYKKCLEGSLEIKASHEFPTREDADKWLASGKAKDAERVKIAGKGFMVVYVSGRPLFMVAPLPEELETDEWKDDSE